MQDEYLNKMHELSERILKNEISLEKGIDQLERYINTIDKRVNNDIGQEIWDIKQNIKKISQNEKDIAVLSAQFTGFEKLFDAHKESIKQRDDKWYKNIGLWISIFALLISGAIGYLNYTKNHQPQQFAGESNVLSNNKK